MSSDLLDTNITAKKAINGLSNPNANSFEYSTKIKLLAYIALFTSPMFFSSNIVIGKMVSHIAPFTLAFLRWFFSALILLYLTRKHHALMLSITKQHWRLLLVLAFFSMFICGGIVYLGLQTTSATNGTLIYTLPPVLIIILERFWRNRPMKFRETIGIVIAFIGVGIIVSKASLQNLLEINFTPGDLFFLLAAISWAFYSVGLRSKVLSELETLPLFAMVAIFGTILLLPFSVYEYSSGSTMPSTSRDWWAIVGIVVFASLLSFSVYQFGIKILGPTISGIFMYLLPPFGVGAAWYFLSETIYSFHIFGIITILGGVVLATFPNLSMSKSNKLR